MRRFKPKKWPDFQFPKNGFFQEFLAAGSRAVKKGPKPPPPLFLNLGRARFQKHTRRQLGPHEAAASPSGGEIKMGPSREWPKNPGGGGF
jgi:hypothetical protein